MTMNLVAESTLTRAVRTLLRDLKAQITSNISISVSAEYDDTAEDGLAIVALAELPSIVITGPTLSENRFYSMNQIREFDVPDDPDQTVTLQGPPLTADLRFSVTGAANSTAQMLNMMSAVSAFFNQNKWLSMARDPEDPSSESVRWELDFDVDFRISLDGPDDIRAFTAGFVIRGFDVHEGAPVGATRPVEEVIVDIERKLS
jgi:hypothetical protein